MEQLPGLSGYRFGDFYVDAQERLLLKGETEVKIAPKTFDVLELLLKRNGELITKDQLLASVWDGRFVEEKNITVHIARLRKLLGESRESPYIKTIFGAGYRFVAEIESQPVVNLKNVVDGESLAVLPLRNENGSGEIEYLADGLTESLINSLSYMPDFTVLARDTVFRYKNKEVNAKNVGDALGVSTVLTGRLRVVKEDLIVGVEIIRVSDGAQIWGTQVRQSLADIFEMQEKITLSISESLSAQSSEIVRSTLPQELIKNSESYRLYLNGKYLLDKRSLDDLNRAIRFFHRSIECDPNNVLSYIGLSDCYFWLYIYDHRTHEETLPIISELIAKAMSINKEVPELYLTKGRVEKFAKWNLKKAEEYFKKAISLNPNYTDVHLNYAYLLLMCGKFSDAQERMEYVAKLTPFSTLNSKNLAKLYYFSEQYENAVSELEKVFQQDKDDYVGLNLLGATLSEIGKYDEAIRIYRRTLDMQYHFENFAMIGYINARRGNYSEANETLNILEKEAKKTFIPATYRGIIYSALGEVEEAFSCLENSVSARSTDLIGLKSTPGGILSEMTRDILFCCERSACR